MFIFNENTMNSKTVLEFGFCDTQNYQGLAKSYSKAILNITKSLFILCTFVVRPDVGMYFSHVSI